MHHNLDFDSCLQIIMQSMAFSKLKFFNILFIYLYILYILFKNELTHLLINELL